MKILVIILTAITLAGCQHPSQKNISSNPTWAKEAIWYQIFPERFANGDVSNDPNPIDMEGAWPYFTPDGWQIHPWASDWYKLQPWETKLNKNFYDIVNIRRYGGDIQGIINKLDYLKELGVNAIYINPIFESPSLHKYDAAMFHHIDNNFGPDPDGDRKIWTEENPNDPSTWKWTSADKLFLQLIKESHKRNMKIIIDGVFNHTGTQFWAFKDIVANQEKSIYKDWFIIKKFDNPNTTENEFEYAGWYGVRDLPEIKEDTSGLVSGPREHIHAVVKRWMDPNGDGDPSDGIDGWRLDVAEMVNHNFWKDFRKWVREINSDAYITGEVWWEDWNNYKMFNAAPWLQGDQFDAVMNYRFTRAVKDFVLANKIKTDAKTFTDTISSIMNQYKDNYYVMMNLLGSHDTERLHSLAVNPDGRYDHQGNVRDKKTFDIRKANAIERARIKLASAIQFTMPGAPHIYNGDETAMWGGDDPDCRKPMVWNELNYESETTHPYKASREMNKVEFDQEFFNWYKNLSRIRTQNPELALGNFKFNIIDNQNGILSYSREYEGKQITIILNCSNLPYQLDMQKVENTKGKKELFDLNNEKNILYGNSVITLDPFEILILK